MQIHEMELDMSVTPQEQDLRSGSSVEYHRVNCTVLESFLWAKLRNSMNYLYIILGLVFTGLGAVGAMFPVLPTTPFLLLAAACFAKGSPHWEQWFHGTKLYQDNLAEFMENRSLSRRNKILFTSFASTMMVISFFLVDSLWVKAILIVINQFMYWYFVTQIKTSDG